MTFLKSITLIVHLRHYLPALAIVGTGLLSHGLILLTDYRLWDGWEYALWLGDPRQLPFLTRLFSEIGRPLDGLYWRPFFGLQNSHIVAKAAGVTAWIAHAIFMYECLRRPWALGAAAALAAAMLSVACPVFRPLGELSLWMNTAAVAIFWAAIYLVVLAHEARSLNFRVALRGCALVALFLSLNLNSLLVYFYGLLAALLGLIYLRHGRNSAISGARMLIQKYPDVCILPLIFWGWKTFYTPSYGAYASYNQPNISLSVLANGYAIFATNFVLPFIADAVSRPSVAFGVSIGIAALIYRFGTGTLLNGLRLQDDAHRELMPYLCSAGFLLVAASFPYIVVGQVLADDAWLGRNNILTPLGLSLLVTGILIKLSDLAFPSASKLWFAGVVVVCIVWGVASASGYARLQAFGVKQLAIQGHLQRAIENKSPAVIQLRDYASLPGAIPYYPPLIWTALAACCDSLPKTLVFDSRPFTPDKIAQTPAGDTSVEVGVLNLNAQGVEELIRQSTVDYALSAIPRTGRHLLMTISRPFDPRSEADLGFEYLKKRWLDADQGAAFIQTFLQSQVVEVERVR
jgi:hypothetical protein